MENNEKKISLISIIVVIVLVLLIAFGVCGVRIDIWTHFMRGCIIRLCTLI